MVCPSCQAKLRRAGPVAFGIEIAYLLLSFAIYSAVQGNWVEFAAMMPVALVICILQHRCTRLELVKPQSV